MQIEKENMHPNNAYDPLKAKYNNIDDFKKYFTFKLYYPHDVPEDYKKTEKESYVRTIEKLEEYYKYFIEKIESEYKEGDELLHFSSFDVSQLRRYFPMRGCVEYIVLKRDGKTIKEFVVRRS